MADAPLTFDAALAALAEQVTQLESGQLSLEASLAAFEAGVALSRQCQQALDEAEQKVRLLTAAADGSAQLTPMPAPPTR